MPFYLREYKIAGKSFSFATIIWFLLTIISTLAQLKKGIGTCRNYLIFKGVFFHSINKLPLFAAYPAEYQDTNHYGPFFSFVIAPFALLPNYVGVFMWCIANAFVLFYAVKKLPISDINKNIILLIGLVEMMTAIHNVQFNPMASAWIILTYVMVKDKKDIWATLFIAAGILVKLYGIVGLAFFLFSDHKLKFVLSFIFWMALFFCLPMLLSSPQFVVQAYQDWYTSLSIKNAANNIEVMQGMTAMRVIDRVFCIHNIPNIVIIASASLVYFGSLLRYKYFKNTNFQLSFLASLLIAVVIFSSSAEAATFIIAMMGVAIWFINEEKKSPLVISLLIFAIVLTSLSTTDAFPKFVKVEYVRPYALKALPCLLVWLVLAYQLLFKKYDSVTS